MEAWQGAVLVAAGLLALLAIAWIRTPVTIRLRAPADEGLFLLRIRHPVLVLDVWLPPDIALGWALGERELPGIHGEVMGIPLSRSAIDGWARSLARSGRAVRVRAAVVRREPPGEPAPDRAARIGTQVASLRAWLDALIESRTRLAAAATVDRVDARIAFGTGNPESTGLLLSSVWMFEPWLPDDARLRIDPIFNGLHLSVRGEIVVRVFPWGAARAMLCVMRARRRSRRAAPEPARAGSPEHQEA